MPNENNNASQPKVITNSSSGALYFNCPTALVVRVGIPALQESLAHDLLARVLGYLSKPTDDLDAPEIARAVLQRTGIVAQAGQDFGATSAVSEWLTDASGHHIFEAIRRAHRRVGFGNARSIVAAWREQTRRDIAARAAAMTDEILTELDRARTLGNHSRVVSEIIGVLNSVRQTIEDASANSTNYFNDLENRLQNARNSAQRATRPSSVRPTVIRWNDFRGHYYNLRARFFGSNQATAIPQNTASGTFDILERELLTAQLNLAALETEQSLVVEIIALLEEERCVDEDASVLFAEAENEARRTARQMETTRQYGLAGGELLLNGEDLTAATMNCLFGSNAHDTEEDSISIVVLSRFAESLQSADWLRIIASRQTSEISTTVSELSAICRQLTVEKMRGFTIADALSALLQNGVENWHAKLTATFRGTLTPKFLAANYDKFLDLQIFAAVVYAPGALPESSERLRSALAMIKQDIGLNFDVKLDGSADDRLLFYCEYFCVPLEALCFYDESRSEFESVKNLPKFNPHSLLRDI